MKEAYQSPEIEIIKFEVSEEVNSLTTTSGMDGNDIQAMWLRGS
jgi:hypothetical protein